MKYCLIVAICLLFVFPLYAQEPPPPFLYYYNPDQNAFVIERADGTETRLLAEHLMPADTNAFRDMAWSPSGEWLAWTASHDTDNDPQSGLYVPYVVSHDGTKILTGLADYQTAILNWSPVDDWLLVIGVTQESMVNPETGLEMNPLRFALIDPDQDNLLAAYEILQPAFLADYGIQSQPIWTVDGKYALSSYPLQHPNGDPYATAFLIFDPAKQTIRQTLVFAETLSGISPEGWIAEKVPLGSSKSLVFRNLISGAFVLPPDPVGFEAEGVYDVVWNPKGRYGVIWGNEAWLVDLSTKSILSISTGIISNPDDFWDSAGTHGAWVEDDDSLFVLDPLLGTVSSVIENASEYQSYQWIGEHELLIPQEDDFYRYDLLSQTLTPLSATDLSVRAVSSDWRYAAGTDYRDPYLIDLEAGISVQIPSHPLRPSPTDYDADMLWHPTVDWFILIEKPFVSMMGADPFLYRVIEAGGDRQRDLGYCLGYCAGWLP